MAQQPIELILTRQWASYLAVPVWLVGADGELLFYNEAAEAIVGRRFDESGEMPLSELSEVFEIISDEDESPVPPEQLALGIALFEHRAAHQRIRIRGLDGVWRRVDATAFPLEGQGGRFLGAVVLFWDVGWTA
jgi:PAS domain-containing protein